MPRCFWHGQRFGLSKANNWNLESGDTAPKILVLSTHARCQHNQRKWLQRRKFIPLCAISEGQTVQMWDALSESVHSRQTFPVDSRQANEERSVSPTAVDGNVGQGTRISVGEAG
jgi:hypothetical protein